MRTANPALNERVFAEAQAYGSGETMSIQGTVNKTLILLFLLIASAIFVWRKLFESAPMFEEAVSSTPSLTSFQAVAPFVMGGLFGGMIFGFVTIFKKDWAAVTAPIYTICQGFLLGGISGFFEIQYPGIVVQAVGLTFGVLFCLLLAYQSRLIKPSENFKLGVVAATGAIFVLYLVNFILGFFKISIPFIHSSGPLGIGFSLIVVTIAALNLVLDFDFIEQGVRRGAPRHMEWYGAFGLMVTLIWLYIEVLRLLAKLRERR